MTQTLAIIPARGGSKRLPRKNIMPFLDRPMIVHTIEHALAVPGIARVIVSTEDTEIADVSAVAGAVVHIRDANLATDTATVTDVCVEVLDNEARAGRNYQVMACLYATAPLRTAADIAAVVGLVVSGNADFAIAVTPFVPAPHQALKMTTDGTLAPMWSDLVNLRASDLDPMFVDNGSTYAAAIAAFRQHRSFYGPRLMGHVMPRERSVDIDELSDFELASWYAGKCAPATK